MSQGLRSVLVLLSVLVIGTTAQADVSSSFAVNDEGWQAVVIAGGVPGAPFPVTYSATGGNPGGWISQPDTAGNQEVYLAPGVFLGNQAAAYGGSLKFDAQSTIATAGIHTAVILIGNGVTLVYRTGALPGTTWTPYTIPLTPVSGWRVGNGGGPTPTVAQMQAVLGNLTTLYINSDWSSAGSIGGLTNVQLINGPLAKDFSEGAYWNSPGPTGSEGACHIEGSYLLLAERSRPRLSTPVLLDSAGNVAAGNATSQGGPTGNAHVFAIAPAPLAAGPATFHEVTPVAVLSAVVLIMLLGGVLVAVSNR